MLLDALTLSDAVELSAALRRIGAGADSMAELADRVVRYLHETLLNEDGEPAGVLVRLFATERLGDLDPALRDLATEQLAAHGDPADPATRCLTLQASIGAEPAWCHPEGSRNHRVIPLPNTAALARAPMTAALLRHVGVSLGFAQEDIPARWQRSNVFHVEDARGDPQVPDQVEFIEPYGVRSVLGFGGMLPTGEVFAVILFSSVHVGAEVAALFEPVAQSVRLGLLPLAVADAQPHSALSESEIRSIALERLLEVQEQATSVQARRLEEEARISSTLLSVAESISSHLALSDILQVVTDAATGLCGAHFGAFFYNVVSDGAEGYRLFILSGAPREAFSRFPQPRPTAIFGPTFRGEPPIRIEDVTKDPRYGAMPPYHGLPPGHPPVRSYLGVPVNSRSGEVIGGLFFGHQEPGRFTAVHERLMVGLARHAALAIDNARLYEEAQERLTARELALEQVRRAEHRYRSLVRASSQLVWRTPADGRVIDLPEWREFTGQSQEEVRGWGWLDAVHPDDRELTREAWQKAVAAGDMFEAEYRLRSAEGEFRPHIARGVPVLEGGEVREWVGMCIDISDLRRQEAERREVLERLQLFAHAGQTFASALDVETVVTSLLRILVPAVADWGCVYLRGGDQRIRLVGMEVADTEVLPRLREVLEQFEVRADQPYGAGYVIATGEAQWLPEISDAVIEATSGGDRRTAQRVRDLRPTSGVIVPLATRGRVLGALSLATARERRLTEPDRELIEEVARRAALSLDNARLFEGARDLAVGLQQGLLPVLPSIPGIDICSRYLAAARTAEVGGDWYDAFVLQDGSVGLAIGDVMGHDVVATTAMGQLRSVLRSCAWEGQAPGRVLERLDQLVQVFGMADLATLIYARLERSADDGTLLMRYANAGHVPPLLLVPGEPPQLLHGNGNVLIGVPGHSQWLEQTAHLPRGSTVVLYTDGLVERSGEDLDIGLARLCAAAAAAPPDQPLSELCDHLIATTIGEGQADDVAVLTVRSLR